MTNSTPYKDSIAQLLHLEFEWKGEWLDYPAQFGLTVADVPELLRFSLDDSLIDVGEIGAWDVHGLRAVIQLEPQTGINLLFQLLEQNPDADFFHEECGKICQRLGEIAIDPVTSVLQDSTAHTWTRTTAADGLTAIAENHPEHRDICIQAMMSQLRCYAEVDDDFLNDILVSDLIRLKAVEAADLLAEVFAAGRVDEWTTGSWPLAQVDLGLKTRSDFSPQELQPQTPHPYPEIEKLSKTLSYLNRPKLKPAMGFGSSQKKKVDRKGKKKKR